MSTIPLLSASGLRQSVRGLRRRPGFTAAAVLTLALGIGATSAIFGVVYGVLIKPLPYPDSHELVSLRHTAPGLTRGLGLAEHATVGSSYSMYVTYREHNRTFEHVGLWRSAEHTLTGSGETAQISALAVTHGTLHALGVQPVLGRWFSDAEYTLGMEGTDPVILSHAFWQRRFGGDESALGRTLWLDFRQAVVVGIMPADSRFLDLTPQPDVLRPIRTDATQVVRSSTAGSPSPLTLGAPNYSGLARLRDGVTPAEANADAARMLPIWLDAWPTGGRSRQTVADWRLTAALGPLKDDIVGGVAGMLWLLMGAVGAVLLIACANVANLLLVRADARRRELAIRAALGAGRRRIAAELLRESCVLGALGGIAGLVLAYAGLELLGAIAPANLPRVEDIAVGPAVLAFALAAALASSLALGSIPAVKHAMGSDTLLGTSTRGTGASRERNRTRNALIVAQVALALALLVGAGLMIRTFQALTRVDAGFSDPEHVQTARIFIPFAAIPGPTRYTRVYGEVLERIAALPGVTAAGFGTGLPLEGRGTRGAIFVESRPDAAVESPPTRRFTSVTQGYFEALGTRLVAGRDLTRADVEQSRDVALVSENLARELWGEPQAAIGERIRWSRAATDAWHEIVGVTQDVRLDALHERPPPIVYTPLVTAGSDLRGVVYAIRSERAGTESFVNEVRRAVWTSHEDIVVDVRTMQDLYTGALARTSFVLVLLAIAGAMALVLSVVGIHAVVSYVVTQRSHEIGIRLALGAEPNAVRSMLVQRALAVALIGLVTGLAAAAALSRWLTSLLFEVRPLDPGTYVAVLGLLLAAVSLAAYVPARRAARLDPSETLRAQ